MDSTHEHTSPVVLSIGCGNMASAILGGVLKAGWTPESVWVVDPNDDKRAQLQAAYSGVQGFAQVADAPADAKVDVVLWAVKPQVFQQVAAEARAALQTIAPNAMHISVAAGIGTQAIAQWLGTENLVRTMPNTPALVGKGMTGLYAMAGVSADSKQLAERVLQPTGELLWVEDEAQLDVVTALSGSGPAYVFYFLQAMVEAGEQMGMSTEQARTLAQATFAGATALAQQSDDALEVLRQRVTSKGGTTHEAIISMENSRVREHIHTALHACRARAEELGKELV